MTTDKTADLYKNILDLEAADALDQANEALDTLIETRATSIEGVAGKVRYLAKLYCPGDDGDLVGKLIASLDADLGAHVPA